MPTRDDYRVLQGSVYFEVCELENAETEAELRKGIKRLKARLASTMTEKEIDWVESKLKNLD